MKCWLFAATILLTACSAPPALNDTLVFPRVPPWFPDPVYPSDNHPSQLRIELGRRLFFHTGLSADGRVSCASCHVPSSAFTDGRVVSEGAHGKLGKRNAPTLANLAWMPYFMMEGGVPTLEVQVLAPMIDTLEMAHSILASAGELRSDDYLNALSKAAYGRELDPYVITRALACYQRTFISGDTRYDRTVHQGMSQMTEQEERGRQLFFSERTHCASCHREPFFTDFGFYNVGLYAVYPDAGKERETYQAGDNGKFKTPTLRNIELTAPYMHDGSMATLQEVIAFYNQGGNPHPNKDRRIAPMGLSAGEEEDLVAFLRCLTDWNFVQNAAYLPLEE